MDDEPLTEQNFARRLGQNIRLQRKGRRWSQEVLGTLAGLHRNYIGMVERGELHMRFWNLFKIARALEVPLELLLSPVSPLMPVKRRRSTARSETYNNSRR